MTLLTVPTELAAKVICEHPPNPCHPRSIHRQCELRVGCWSSNDIAVMTLDEILSLPSAGSRKHPHKDVLCMTDSAGATVYVKRQWAWDRRWPRWSDWRDGVAGLSDPVRESRGLQALAPVGLQGPEPLRLLTDADPRSPRSAIVMSAVPVSRSLAEMAQCGELQRLGPFARRGLTVALMQMTDRLHQHGLRWRSMKAKHVFPQHVADEGWRLWLIDCEGIRPRATRRQQRRDRRLLLRSLQTSGADAAFVEMVGGMRDMRYGTRVVGLPMGNLRSQI